jgi:hypothetical protein
MTFRPGILEYRYRGLLFLNIYLKINHFNRPFIRRINKRIITDANKTHIFFHLSSSVALL